MRAPALLVAVFAAALVAAGCGGKGESAPVVRGPGIKATEPPWKPETEQLAARMKKFGVPPPGTEKYHHHAQLNVYADGLLVPVPTHIGIGKTVSGLHTHAPGGVIHIEASKPFTATLGDFSAMWGVPFGPKQVGNLTNEGKNRVQALANGKPVDDPIDYVIREGDNIVVGYGKPGSFPKEPDTTLLRKEQSGESGGCGERKKGEKKKKKSCVAE